MDTAISNSEARYEENTTGYWDRQRLGTIRQKVTIGRYLGKATVRRKMYELRPGR